MGHDSDEHEVTRDDLFKPVEYSFFHKAMSSTAAYLIDKPVTFFKESIVDKCRTPQVYYHERYNRVPSIESCKVGDHKCIYEANAQYKRDRLVDGQIVVILRNRLTNCKKWYNHEREDIERFCLPYKKEYEDAATNFFIKYGDISNNRDVISVLMKQKHRLLWERRYGPVGTGRQDPNSLSTTDIPTRGYQAAEETVKGDNMFDIFKRHFINDLPKEIRR